MESLNTTNAGDGDETSQGMTVNEPAVCLWQSAIPADNGHFYPSFVTEGVVGHTQTDWDYGTDYDKARQTVAYYNQERGRSEEESLRIVTSSMMASEAAKLHVVLAVTYSEDEDAEKEVGVWLRHGKSEAMKLAEKLLADEFDSGRITDSAIEEIKRLLESDGFIDAHKFYLEWQRANTPLNLYSIQVHATDSSSQEDALQRL